MKQYGLQLWTVHVDCEKDLRAVLRKTAELGYEKVEFVDYYGLTAEELRAELEKNRLIPVSRQMLIEAMEEDIDGAIAYAKTIGLENIASCVMDVSNAAALRTTIERLRPLVEKVTGAGLRFLYHNHGPEFVPVEGRRPIDVLLETFSTERFGLELDTYWALSAGADILRFMEENAPRIQNIHIKGGDGKGKSLPFDRSAIDVKAIVACAHRLGIEDVLVEDDRPDPDGMTVAERNIRSLREWNL